MSNSPTLNASNHMHPTSPAPLGVPEMENFGSAQPLILGLVAFCLESINFRCKIYIKGRA